MRATISIRRPAASRKRRKKINPEPDLTNAEFGHIMWSTLNERAGLMLKHQTGPNSHSKRSLP